MAARLSALSTLRCSSNSKFGNLVYKKIANYYFAAEDRMSQQVQRLTVGWKTEDVKSRQGQ
jgi:hypothetical protein